MRFEQALFIDVTRLFARYLNGRLPTGVDRVSIEYIRHYLGSAQAIVRYQGRWLELSLSDSTRLFDTLITSNFKIKLRIIGLITKAWWYNFLPLRKEVATLLEVGHQGLEQPSYAKKLSTKALNPIFFVHDLIPISHPEYCRPDEAIKHTHRMNIVLQQGCGVIVNSAATLNELTIYAEKSGFLLPPVVVAPLAVSALPTPSVTSMVDTPYFVMLGTIEPRKNHLMILQVWRRLIEQLGISAPKLVIIGQRGWENENIIDMLERCEFLKGYVFELSNCNDADMTTYLQHAQALLFPSFAEGYGIPLVESLMLGTPVIASQLKVFYEIAGDIPEYLDPLDAMGWLDKIIAYSASDNAERLIQLNRLIAFKVPSWQEHFDSVDRLVSHISKK